MQRSLPKKVSIGIPVLNGACYLAKAINSLLDQDYEQLEIIISDNCSSDQTRDIYLGFAATDCRIRYYRQPKTISGFKNFRFCLEAATGDYFAWLAHDDWYLDRSYVTKLATYMEEHDDVVCSTSDVSQMDKRGYGMGQIILEELRGEKVWSEVRKDIFSWGAKNALHAVYGLFRRQAVSKCILEARRIQGLEITTGTEFPFLARIACLGRIVSLPFIGRVQMLHQKSVWHTERVRYDLKLKQIIDNAYDMRLKMLLIALTAEIPVVEKASLVVACVRGILRGMRMRGRFARAILQSLRKFGFRVHRIRAIPSRRMFHEPFSRFVETHYGYPRWQSLSEYERSVVVSFQPLFASHTVSHVLVHGLKENDDLLILDKHFPERHYFLTVCQFTRESLKSNTGTVCELPPIFADRSRHSAETKGQIATDGKSGIGPIDLAIIESDSLCDVIEALLKRIPTCQAIVLKCEFRMGIITSDQQMVMRFLFDEGFRILNFGPTTGNEVGEVEKLYLVFSRNY